MSKNNTTALMIDQSIDLEIDDAFGPRRIACLQTPARESGAPGLFWLSGFNSVMTGTKANDLAAWAADRGYGMTRFDYSGHGRSSGTLEEGTISAWLAESLKVFCDRTTCPQILVGSSMGGWLALLMGRELRRHQAETAERLKGIVLIAPAWDMTERLMWRSSPPEIRRQLEANGIWHRPSAYGGSPYPITMKLIEDGRQHGLGAGPIETGCPVRIIHGLADMDVPWQGSVELTERLATNDVRLTLLGDGEHRLSRPEDMRLLKEAIAGLINRLPEDPA